MNGILCVNKPQDFTSFDVIGKLRGILKMKRLGHAGTLDPMATGVLPVFVGNATKACDIIPNNEKSYRANFKLGVVSDTQDVWGSITKTFDKKVTEDDILKAIPQFIGNISQMPPMYSAVQINGQRLYDLARKGIEVEREKRQVFIDDVRLESFNQETQEGVLFIACSKGTYIRTIINDLGDSLQCGGIMTDLVRLSSSGFNLDECFTFEEIQKACDENQLEKLLVPVERMFLSLPKLTLDDVQTKLYRNGVKLDLERVENILPDQDIYRIYDDNDCFIGTSLANRDENILRVAKNLTQK